MGTIRRIAGEIDRVIVVMVTLPRAARPQCRRVMPWPTSVMATSDRLVAR